MPKFLCTVLLASIPVLASAQFDEDQLGAWYMYMWTLNPGANGLGLQGDIQHRNWDSGGDLEQLLVRGGLTWSPEGRNVKYTFGGAWVASGTFGPGNAKSYERRLYQEALIPQLAGTKVFLTHRLRFEQRDVDGQDLRTRLRYFVGLNYPLNQAKLGRGAIYVSLYNEFFLNLERGIGQGRQVDYFDRNRAYAALGYSVTDRARLQFGYMRQDLDEAGKGQLQFNLVHSF